VHLLDLLGFLLLVLLALLLDLAFLLLLLLVLLLLSVVVGDFLLLGLLDVEFDGELDELGVLADDVLALLLVELLELVVLHVEDQARAALEVLQLLGRGGADVELAARVGLPDVAVGLVLLGDDGDLVGHEEGRVEADSELSDERHVGGALVVGLEELARAGVGDDTEALHQVSLAHADAGVLDDQLVVGLVGDDADAQVGVGLELLGRGDRELPDLVQCVGAVGDQLSQEDFLVGVDAVDDDFHQSCG